MKRCLLLITFILILFSAGCDLPETTKPETGVSLMIQLWNYDSMSYEIFVNDTKYVTMPGRDPGTFFYCAHFTMYVYMRDTYQLEIKNAGYVYDAISFTPADDAVSLRGGTYGDVAEYGISFDIKNAHLYFSD
jgi:hypothetical protein